MHTVLASSYTHPGLHYSYVAGTCTCTLSISVVSHQVNFNYFMDLYLTIPDGFCHTEPPGGKFYYLDYHLTFTETTLLPPSHFQY